MKRIVTLAAVVFFTSVPGAAELNAQYSPAPMSTQTMVISGGTLIDGTGKQPLADSVIVIQGNTIQSVGPKGSIAVPAVKP